MDRIARKLVIEAEESDDSVEAEMDDMIALSLEVTKNNRYTVKRKHRPSNYDVFLTYWSI